MNIDNQTLLLLVILVMVLVVVIVILVVINANHKMMEATQHQMADLHLNINKDMSDFQLNVTNAIKGDLNSLNENTMNRMSSMQYQVNENMRLSMETTNKALTNVLVEMGKLQSAQANLEELGKDITSLQNVLTDKKTRGTFGEVELYSILESSFGVNDQRFRKQYKLSNGSMVDAIIVAPEPLGLIPVDSKFPLENYNRIYDGELTPQQQQAARNAFKSDCKKHIDDIARKYVAAEETSDFAYMFVPAEAVFAEIYGHCEDVVEYSYQKKVYIVSPTTLMAYITAIKAIYLGQSKNEKVGEIQEELSKLSQEFERFAERWNAVSKDFNSIADDMHDVDVTAKKIMRKFEAIENVELDQEVKPNEIEEA